jgi:hypothetical protein
MLCKSHAVENIQLLQPHRFQLAYSRATSVPMPISMSNFSILLSIALFVLALTDFQRRQRVVGAVIAWQIVKSVGDSRLCNVRVVPQMKFSSATFIVKVYRMVMFED